MSQVDYDQKIQEINKLKISDAEKSKWIRVLVLQQKQADGDKVKTVKAAEVSKPVKAAEVSKPVKAAEVSKPVKAAEVSKPITMKASVTELSKPVKAAANNPIVNNEEKQAKIKVKALFENKPEKNVAVQESIERIRKIHDIRNQNLTPIEKMNKIRALTKKS